MILDKLDNLFSSNPKMNILSTSTKELSVEELVYSIGAYSKSLSAIGIHSKLHVALLFRDVQNVIEIILSCWKIGAIPILIPFGSTDNEICKLLKNSKSKVIITDWSFDKTVSGVDIQYHFIEELSQGMGSCVIPDYIGAQSYDEVCLILFTSGSMGLPKAVQLTYKNLIESASQWNDELGFRQIDKYLNFLPIHHIGGISIFIRSILFCFKSIQFNSFDAKDVLEMIKNNKVTLVSLVPKMLKTLIEFDKEDVLKVLRGIVLSGGPSDDEIIKKCIEEKLPIYKSYGMTETGSGISGFWLNKNPKKYKSVGKIFSNTYCKIIDKQLILKGPSIMRGYVGSKKIKDWFNTGDYANIDKDGYIFIHMRRKDRIVTGGENVDPKEIESILLKHPEINWIKVYGKFDKNWGQIIAAEVHTKLSADEIIYWLKNKVSSYKIPKYIEIV